MNQSRSYLRFRLSYRLEHWLLVFSFTVLALTGLVQKFAQNDISIFLIGVMGGIQQVRVIHRIAATMLMLESVYHIGSIGYNLIVRRAHWDMMPRPHDLVNGINLVLYNLGLRAQRPQQGRYTAEEKVEYLSLVWGTALMIITGFMLWNPIATTSVLPGQAIPMAKAAHGGEALLAVLAVLVWHFYHVHIRSFNTSMFTGYLSEEEMEEEHPLELERIREGQTEQPMSGRVRRRRVFLTAYGILALVMLGGIYVFVSFEKTAIETVQPAATQVPRLAHVNDDGARGLMTAADDPGPLLSWDTGVGQLFAEKCTLCHGGTVPLAGLDLRNYDDALLSDTESPAIVPYNPLASGIIIQQNSVHPVQLTELEFAGVYSWIERGAPQQEESQAQ